MVAQDGVHLKMSAIVGLMHGHAADAEPLPFFVDPGQPVLELTREQLASTDLDAIFRTIRER